MQTAKETFIAEPGEVLSPHSGINSNRLIQPNHHSHDSLEQIIGSHGLNSPALDFKPSNAFEQCHEHMNAPEQQTIRTQIGGKTFYMRVKKYDPKRTAFMLRGYENILYDFLSA